MGMFDYVEFRADCRLCGTPLRDFQSKCGPCQLRTLAPSDIDGGRFYTYCEECWLKPVGTPPKSAWHEWDVIDGVPRLRPADDEQD